MGNIILPKDLRNEVVTAESDLTNLFSLFSNVLRPESASGPDASVFGHDPRTRMRKFREIARDPYVAAALARIKTVVAGLPFRVDAASEDEADQKAAEHWRAQFQRFDINTALHRMLDAELMGFHVHEIMWTVDDDGYIAVDRLVPRGQERFVFTSKPGGVTGDFDLRLLTKDAPHEGIETPHRKFMVHRMPGATNDPYGDPLAPKLYWHVLFKRTVEEFWVRHLERFGMPMPWAVASPGAQPSDKHSLLQMLKGLGQNGAAVLDHGSTIQKFDGNGSGTAQYEAFIEFCNYELSALIYGEPEGKGDGGATASAATTKREIRQAKLEGVARLCADTLNTTVIAWCNEMNGFGRCKLVIDAQLEEDLTARAGRDKILVDMGFRPSIEYVNDTYGGNWTEKAPAPDDVPPLPSGEGEPGNQLRSELPTDTETGERVDKVPTAQFADAARARSDELSPLLDAVEAVPDLSLMAQLDEFVEPAMKIVQGEATFSEMQAQLTRLYPKLSTKQLQGALAQAAFTANVYGRVQIDGAQGEVEFANDN